METTTPSQPWAANSSDSSQFRMIDVGGKTETRRRAVAQGSISVAKEAFDAIVQGRNPKGNVLALAEVAGIMAAKRTSDSIPLCHPLPLDYARVRFELNKDANRVDVFCEVGTTAKTGVEMEALAGVNGALLTIYDLSKAVDPAITISGIRLNTKEGGKSGLWNHPDFVAPAAPLPRKKTLAGVSVAVLTVSDRVSRGHAQDQSGPHLTQCLHNEGAFVTSHDVVPDEISQIQKAVMAACENPQVAVLITTGGTGLSPRDVTPEAIEALIHRKIPGFSELLRQDGAKHIPTAWLSRSLACVIGNTLVIALPGSRNAVDEGFNVLLPILPHALHTLKGGDHG